MYKFIHRYSSPNRFLKIIDFSMPIFFTTSFVFILAGLWFGLIDSPPDYQQGDTVRIMYVHVPSAWISLLSYSLIAFLSFINLVWKYPISIILAIECAPIGALFTFIALITGSIWGNPTWGTWWIWDARLTSFLIIFFIFLGLIIIGKSFDNSIRKEKTFAILALIGAFNIPIIKFSVDWWNTLHQPASVFKVSGPTISNEMLLPLILMAIGFSFLFFSLMFLSTKIEIIHRKIISIRSKKNYKVKS